MRQGIYARVSTRDQDGSAQIARLREWAAREGRVVTLERTDNATGRNLLRPGMEALLQAARGRHIDAVAVTRLDRFTRSLIDLSRTLQELRELGVEFRAIDQGIAIVPDRREATSSLQVNVLGAVAEWESTIIGERTADSLAYRASQGVRLGRPPKYVIHECDVERAVRLRTRRGYGWSRLTEETGLPPGARTSLRSRVIAAIRKGGQTAPSKEGPP